MNQCPHANSLRAGGAALNIWLAAAVCNSPASASAQEALRNVLAAQAAAPAPINLESMPYTVKSGDFRLLITPSMEMDWNNNIDASRTNALQDYILRPLVQLNATYPITQVNLLQLNVGFGYDEYIEHSAYSSWRVTSGSQLSFDTYIKDVRINVHERFDYSQDSGGQAVVAGVGNYGAGHNVAGVLVAWNPKDINMSLGYDHRNVLSTATQFGAQDSSSELINGRVGWKFQPTASVGIEATYSTTSYDQMVLNNNSSYTVGAYGQWDPGSYFHVIPHAGYTITQFQETSQSGEVFHLAPAGSPIVAPTGVPIRTANLNSWYADLTLSHEITQFLSYSLSAGHQIEPGIQSDAVEDSYVRLSSNWKVIKDLGLGASFSYEHGQQGAGNISGNLTEIFDFYTFTLEVNRQLTTRLRMGLNSRLTFRSSSSSDLGYTQALVGLHMAYAFE